MARLSRTRFLRREVRSVRPVRPSDWTPFDGVPQTVEPAEADPRADVARTRLMAGALR